MSEVVAVSVFLLEGAQVEIAADLPVFVDVELAGEGDRARLVLRRLGKGENASEALAQEVEWRRTDDAEIGGRACGDEV